MNDIGKFLIRELNNKHLTQGELSRMAGTTETTISRIIRGER